MQTKKNYLTLGFGFFALLFGAGNLLFPPVLGIHSGKFWWLAITGFIISDAIFALLTLYLFTRFGSLKALGAQLGSKFMTFYSTVIVMIFAFFILPRTASVTYEMSVAPFVSADFNSWIFYIIYFAFVLLFTLKQSKVFDTLGRYFAPILAITIIAVVIIGIIGIPTHFVPINNIPEVFRNGFISGYQTADLLGSLFQASFAAAILNSQGYSKIEERGYVILRAGIVCFILFVFLYFGLCYVGARVGMSVSADITPVQALQYIAFTSLGKTGMIFLAFTVFITCFTTTMGILGIVSNFMSDQLIKKVSYTTWAFIFTITSILVAHKGVDFILVIAAPILLAVYPIMIALVTLKLFNIHNTILIKITCYTALIFSIIDALASLKITWASSILHIIPLGDSGFVWLLPSIFAYIVGYLIIKQKKISTKVN